MFNHVFVTPPVMYKVEDENGKRTYRIPAIDKNYESVTTYIGRNFEKPYLEQWRKKVGDKKATEIRNNAAFRGSSLHKATENYLLNKEQDLDNDPNNKSLFLKIRPILDRMNNIRMIETPLYSEELELAGTPDLICDYSGHLAVCDVKSATRLKKKLDIIDYWIQTACYAIMFNEHYGQMPTKAVIIMGVPDVTYGVTYIVDMADCITWLKSFRIDPPAFCKRLQVAQARLKSEAAKTP